MTKLVWDKVGERVFETGLDRGVLYLSDDSGVPWNGLVSVDEQSDDANTPHYMDGIKYLERVIPGDFSAVLNALTYPDEFDEYQGTAKDSLGIMYGNQPKKQFGLSYRTLVGNDVDGVDHEYKVHLLYNLLVNTDTKTYNSSSDQVDPVTFSWTINGVPLVVAGFRATCHLILGSREIGALAEIEDILYGTAEAQPRLPGIDEIITILDGP